MLNLCRSETNPRIDIPFIWHASVARRELVFTGLLRGELLRVDSRYRTVTKVMNGTQINIVGKFQLSKHIEFKNNYHAYFNGDIYWVW